MLFRSPSAALPEVLNNTQYCLRSGALHLAPSRSPSARSDFFINLLDACKSRDGSGAYTRRHPLTPPRAADWATLHRLVLEMPMFLAAAVQVCCTTDVEKNLDTVLTKPAMMFPPDQP